ncbi:aminopeptidase NAALADL1 [Mobula birostris]|uniref:aminopeptidase NAALADL1 n=1 Tax=Mobula birostris TaxID=1983395 RepID=UPI003B289FC4
MVDPGSVIPDSLGDVEVRLCGTEVHKPTAMESVFTATDPGIVADRLLFPLLLDKPQPGMKVWIITGLLAVVCLTIGLLLGHFAIPKDGDTGGEGPTQDIDEQLIQSFMDQIDPQKIKENLRVLAKKPHMATSTGDKDLVKLLLDRWNDPESGLDEAKNVTYNVLLSFPQKEKPNSVTVVSTSGKELFRSRVKEVNYTQDQLDPDVVQPFAAFAPSGIAKGKLVYANQGSTADYVDLIEKHHIDLNNTVAIVKYGGTGRVDKAINGARFGVVGIIVYTDPGDINDGQVSDVNETYPHSWYLPPSGVERGSYKKNFGDQLTPYYPAKDYTFRQKESDIKGLSPIPAQPIGFEDARQLICALGGVEAPSHWQGGLGCTYRLGPGFANESSFTTSDVQVSVFNKREVKPSDNVIGIIRGNVEPDRYVIYGNHRDSWVHGAIDPSSGTAVMLEISRVLGKMVKDGRWRPRRSIIFGSWGAEEFGLIGSTEWTEEFYRILTQRAVAYINVDIAVYANATLRALGSPIVQKVMFDAAKEVPAPGHTDLTVYSNWMKYSNRTSAHHSLIPFMASLGASSDYASFFHYLGVSCMDIAYTFDRSATSARIYPAYHTAFDTFDYASRFIDPGFTSHQAVGRTAGNVLLRLADSALLPLNPGDYMEAIRELFDTAEKELGSELKKKNISLVPLRSAVERLDRQYQSFSNRLTQLENLRERPLQLRKVNDQLMLLERSFLDPLAFPDQLYYRHVLYASQSSPVQTFPGLADAVQLALETAEPSAWDAVRRHITILIHSLDSAASTLDGPLPA